MSSINLPVKYAVMPIEGNSDWLLESERVENFEEIAYIVSKVYLLAEHKVYFSDGKSKCEYEVVFPYKSPNDFRKRKTPEYGIDEYYIHTDKVECVFDSYEEAKKEVNNQNERLRARLRRNLVVTDGSLIMQMELSDKQFDERIDRFQTFEDFIMISSCDMIVDSAYRSKVTSPVKERK